MTSAQTMSLKCLRSQRHIGCRETTSAQVQGRLRSAHMQNLPPNRYIPRMLQPRQSAGLKYHRDERRTRKKLGTRDIPVATHTVKRLRFFFLSHFYEFFVKPDISFSFFLPLDFEPSVHVLFTSTRFDRTFSLLPTSILL